MDFVSNIDRASLDDAVRRGPDVAGFLRNQIVTRQLQAGDRVRVESVAQALNVSATPVREALHALQAEGFLHYQHNRGFLVARLSAADVRDIYVAIGLLAGELAARAAMSADSVDLAPMRAVQERLREASAAEAVNNDDLSELVSAFYHQLHVLGQSPKIVSLVLTLDMYTPQALHVTIPGWLAATVRFHDLLIAALEARQPEAARAAVRGHLGNAAELFSTMYESGSKVAPESH